MSYASDILATTDGVTTGPQAYYRMAEASGLLQDSSGHAMHATSSSGVVSYHAASPISTDPADFSILFNGTQNFQVPDNNLIDFANIYSIEFWVKRTTSGLASAETILDRGSTAFQVYISGSTDPPTERVRLTVPGVGNVVDSTATITDTAWHYVVITKTGATLKVYQDAVDVTGVVTNQTSSTTATPLYIGSTRNVDNFLQSYVDELAIYKFPLTLAQVQAHYASASGQILLPDADLATSGWTTAPLFSKVNDSSDATIITATAA